MIIAAKEIIKYVESEQKASEEVVTVKYVLSEKTPEI